MVDKKGKHEIARNSEVFTGAVILKASLHKG
jgi:hypothetical protein